MNKIIIVDNHLLFIDEIKILIENEGDTVLIEEIKNGTSYLEISKIHLPDFIIINSGSRIENGLNVNGISIIDIKNLNVFDLIYPYENEDQSKKEISNYEKTEYYKKEFEKKFQDILKEKKFQTQISQ